MKKMTTSQQRKDLFLGQGAYSTTPFYRNGNRTTGVTGINQLLKDKALRSAVYPYDISGYDSIFECTDIDLLVKLHEEVKNTKQNKNSNNLLISVIHTYIYMLCLIDEFGIGNAYANRGKHETQTGKLYWVNVKKAIEEMKGRRSATSGPLALGPTIAKKTITPPAIALSKIAKGCKTLLEENHNIILSGAPGTGKTYMAKQIALAMTGSEDRIGFVQFHPSYDYTDFVEGLRPISSVGGSIGFERKDGLFKEFCEKALKCLHTTSHSIVSSTLLSVPRSYLSSGIINSDSIRDVYYAIRDAILNGSTIEIETTRGLKKTLSVNAQGNIQVDDNVVTLDKLNKIFEKCSTLPELQEATSLRDITGIGGYDNLYKALLIYIYKIILGEILLDNPNIFPIEPTTTSKTDIEKGEHNPIFVFIIDEINRGEMSKVFGELFFSIDPGYRGTDGKVRTQYANMESKPNAFDTVLGITDPKDYGHFFVPENVYIIGTMNDIDRSVDSMDFAMRRRFMIKEIMAEDTQDAMFDLATIQKTYPAVTAIEEKVKNKMNALNEVIEGKSEPKIKAKLGSSYSLGASYFQKYYKYNDFGKLWDYHLEGILREYLRGTQNPDGDLKILKEAYENA